jgi:Leucine-rich repeat (LRR) protein
MEPSYVTVIVNSIAEYNAIPTNVRKLIMHFTPPDGDMRRLAPLPENLEYLLCDGINLTHLPDRLPRNLKQIFCDNNQLTTLPNELPPNLTAPICASNLLTQLPDISSLHTLQSIGCDNNNLTRLPILPAFITGLSCENNPKLAELPMIPISLIAIIHNIPKYHPLGAPQIREIQRQELRQKWRRADHELYCTLISHIMREYLREMYPELNLAHIAAEIAQHLCVT